MLQQLWNCLLLLKQRIRVNEQEGDLRFCMLKFGAVNEVAVNETLAKEDGHKLVKISFAKEEPVDKNGAAFLLMDGMIGVEVQQYADLSPAEIHHLKIYLPYCFLPHYARQKKQAIAVSHFAQTLDGKIATVTGDSKWIGNPENLDHAHYMRALCEGILIGTRTLQNDQPSLTVRRVAGANPKRIVVSSSSKDFTCLFNSCPEKILLIGVTENPQIPNVDYKQLTANNGHIKAQNILSCLFEQGIYSVYIEGGAITTSHFLNDNAIAIVQLHFSPQIFGSGISSVVLPEIKEVKQSLQFNEFTFEPIGNSYMFVGALMQE